MARWRQSFYKFVPSWLSRDDGEKVLFSLGYIVDAFIERTRRSLTARFPQWTDSRGETHYAGPTALAMLGAERGIVRGRTEDVPGYTRRLREWRGPRGHLVRGTPFALLRQVWAYFDGIRAQTIDYNGNLFEVTAAGDEIATHGAAWNWTFGVTPYRFWMLLHPVAEDGITAQLDWSDPNLWGGSFGVAGYVVGMRGVTRADMLTMIKLFSGLHPWHPDGTLPEWLVIVLPGSAVPVPDGRYGRWYKISGTMAVAARDGGSRYVALSASVKADTGNPEQFASQVTNVDGSGFPTGNPENVAAWGPVTLADGSTYTGNPASFPISVTLIDDGDDPQ